MRALIGNILASADGPQLRRMVQAEADFEAYMDWAFCLPTIFAKIPSPISPIFSLQNESNSTLLQSTFAQFPDH